MIEIRPAQLGDKERIIDISSRIWDGDDYVPNVFEKWVEEEGGEFSVICVDGVVAGCAKMTLLPNRVLWLEGIRVDTNYRGLGLGKKLADYQLKRAKEIGYNSLELSSFVDNHESLAIVEKRGFERVAFFKFMFKDLSIETNEQNREQTTSKSPLSTDDNRMVRMKESVQKISHSDFDKILEHLSSEPRNGYINFDWTFMMSGKDLLCEMDRRGFLYKYKDTFFGYGDWQQKDDGLTIYFIFGPQEDEVVEYILSQALENSRSNITFMDDGQTNACASLKAWGFRAFTEVPKDTYVFRHKES